MNDIMNNVKQLAEMSSEELQSRLVELQTKARDLSDLDLKIDTGVQYEAMLIMALQELRENPIDGLDECDSDIDDDQLV